MDGFLIDFNVRCQDIGCRKILIFLWIFQIIDSSSRKLERALVRKEGRFETCILFLYGP